MSLTAAEARRICEDGRREKEKEEKDEFMREGVKDREWAEKNFPSFLAKTEKNIEDAVCKGKRSATMEVRTDAGAPYEYKCGYLLP